LRNGLDKAGSYIFSISIVCLCRDSSKINLIFCRYSYSWIFNWVSNYFGFLFAFLQWFNKTFSVNLKAFPLRCWYYLSLNLKGLIILCSRSESISMARFYCFICVNGLYAVVLISFILSGSEKGFFLDSNFPKASIWWNPAKSWTSLENIVRWTLYVFGKCNCFEQVWVSNNSVYPTIVLNGVLNHDSP
jgi:hypothetical protein